MSRPPARAVATTRSAVAGRDVEVGGRAAVEQDAVGARRLVFPARESQQERDRVVERVDARADGMIAVAHREAAAAAIERARLAAESEPALARRRAQRDAPGAAAREREVEQVRDLAAAAVEDAHREGVLVDLDARRALHAVEGERDTALSRLGAPSESRSIANGSAFEARHASRPSASDGSGGSARPVAARTRTAPSRATSTRATASPRSTSTAPRSTEVQRRTGANGAKLADWRATAAF